MYALWQAINPNLNVTPQREQYGTFTLAPNSMSSASTPLEPFTSDDNGPYYTSMTVQQTSLFGYTYPEIQDWNQSPAQLKANVSAAINRLYNPNIAKVKRESGDIMESRALLPGQTTREWSVGLKVNKFDLGGERFIVRLFLGGVPEDPSSWASSSACVGSFPVFPPLAPKIGPVPVIEAFSEISLVQWLNDNGKNTPDAAAMNKFLQKTLEWRVQKVCSSGVRVS